MEGMKQITKEELFKLQALKIANHHREHCDGQTCNIMLSVLLEMAIHAGATFTPEEMRDFL